MRIARHLWTQRRLDQFVDRELDAQLATRVQEHLNECVGCQAEVGALLGLKAALSLRFGRPADAEAVEKLKAWAVDELPTLSA